MTTMLSELYDALVSAGAPNEQARKAAEALANFDGRFHGIDTKLATLTTEITSVKWLLGVNTAAVIGMLIKQLMH